MIQNKGSDTMVNVAQAWAEQYRTVAPDVEVEVSGGGSGVGIAALVKGAVDIANASREMKHGRDRAGQAEQRRQGPRELHRRLRRPRRLRPQDEPASTEITIEQLAAIFAEDGKATRWSDLGVKLPGVKDDTIVRVSRQSSSGTYEFFREHVLAKKDFKQGSRDLNGSKEVVELVGGTPTAIGYSGMGYATAAVKMLKVAPKAGAPAVAPTVANTTSKAYPLARSLHLYTLGEPQGAVKAYIDWILSPAGQNDRRRERLRAPRPGRQALGLDEAADEDDEHDAGRLPADPARPVGLGRRRRAGSRGAHPPVRDERHRLRRGHLLLHPQRGGPRPRQPRVRASRSSSSAPSGTRPPSPTSATAPSRSPSGA